MKHDANYLKHERYSRSEIVQAAVKVHSTKHLALQEWPESTFIIRRIREPMHEYRTPDGVKHLYEDLRVLSGPFKSLGEVAKNYGVSARCK